MFVDFDASGDPQLAAMVSGVENFVRKVHADAEPHWLTLLGTSGAGKTMLAERVIRWAKQHHDERIDKRRSDAGHIVRKRVGLLKWSRCCDWMVRGDYGWIEQAKTDWLVAFDDIGVEYERLRALAASKLYEILEARRGKWTVITANLSVAEIHEKIDPRVASRLFRDGSDLYDVNVADYSLSQFKKRKGQTP